MITPEEKYNLDKNTERAREKEMRFGEMVT